MGSRKRRDSGELCHYAKGNSPASALEIVFFRLRGFNLSVPVSDLKRQC